MFCVLEFEEKGLESPLKVLEFEVYKVWEPCLELLDGYCCVMDIAVSACCVVVVVVVI